jgi:predicted nucleotidyltransferase
MVSRKNIQEIIEKIAQNFFPEKIILFGSYADGNPGPDSDMDLMIIMDTDLPKYKRATPIRLLFNPTPCPMDILVYTPEEIDNWNGVTNHIITEVMEKGQVVYEKE